MDSRDNEPRAGSAADNPSVDKSAEAGPTVDSSGGETADLANVIPLVRPTASKPEPFRPEALRPEAFRPEPPRSEAPASKPTFVRPASMRRPHNPNLPPGVTSLVDRRLASGVHEENPVGWRELGTRMLQTADFLVRRQLSGADDGGDSYREFALNVLFPVLRPLFSSWFQMSVRGLEHVHDRGPQLIVANAGGAVPLEAVIATLAVYDSHPAHPLVRVASTDPTSPSTEVPQRGLRLGVDPGAVEALWRAGEVVGVFPNSVRGRKVETDLIHAAYAAGVPIVPCAVVGTAQSYRQLGELSAVAKLLGLSKAPVRSIFQPFRSIGMVAMASRWRVEFGEPIVATGGGRVSRGPVAAATSSASDSGIVGRVHGQIAQLVQPTGSH